MEPQARRGFHKESSDHTADSVAQVDQSGGELVSLFDVASVLLLHRRQILICMIVGAGLALLPSLFKPARYTATGSFVPQGADASKSGLSGIAGQLGISLPATNLSQSPQFYADLLHSRQLLTGVANDSLVVSEIGSRKRAIVELFSTEKDHSRREENGVKRLSNAIGASVSRTTGVVAFSVSTPWPTASFMIAERVLQAVNEFDLRTRKSQAAEERRFVEGRLAVARQDLLSAENRLQSFLTTNRQMGGSPELTFARDRLQRDVSLQQQVFTSLTQAYEDVRIRELRDTPVITIIDYPTIPTAADARGRATQAGLGLVLGALIGAAIALAVTFFRKRILAGDRRAIQFGDLLTDTRMEMFGWLSRQKRAVARNE